MRVLIVGLALALAACGSTSGGGSNPIFPEPGPAPAPVPLTGPVAYQCNDGTQLMVDYSHGQARVAIIGGPSMVLPNAGEGYYSNGRYGLRGGGAAATWEVGRSAPVSCRGS
ncbi:hypothetical protein [Terricaulis sp.]|uniref:hypothetical protein n=1 Tax=Terricaulis sp. TaxID=2768686 RepID=UPI003783F029